MAHWSAPEESIPVTAIPAATPEGAHKLQAPINSKFAEPLLMTGNFPDPFPPKTGVSRGQWRHPGTGTGGWEKTGSILRQAAAPLSWCLICFPINGCLTSALFYTEKGEMPGAILT